MNENVAVLVSNLSKKYTIGKQKDNSLRGYLTGLFQFKKIDANDFWALKGVNFTVNKGEVIGIIGKNGAGKSTLLKILSQIMKPTQGQIKINGRIASLLEVETGFHPELTGRENIFLNGTILGMSRREVKLKFNAIVEFSGVEKFLDTPVKRYSSGMYVRLAFAIAAHLDPEILIIDEVLAVGDAEFQKKCLGKMKDVAGEGRTVIFVSHDLGMMQSLCKNCYWIDQGQIKNFGPTSKIIEEYTTVETITDLDQRQVESPVSFKKIGVFDALKKEKSTFNFDESIHLEGNFHSNGEAKRELQMCIALLDWSGNRVFSEIQNFRGSDQANFHFNYEIPASLIAPGRYSFLFQVYPPPGNEIFDELKGVLSIEIIDNGSKLSGYSNFGHIILQNEIALNKES